MKTDPNALARFLLEQGVDAKRVARCTDALLPTLALFENAIYRFRTTAEIARVAAVHRELPWTAKYDTIALSLPPGMKETEWYGRIEKDLDVSASARGGLPFIKWLESRYGASVAEPMLNGIRSTEGRWCDQIDGVLEATLPRRVVLEGLPEHMRGNDAGMIVWANIMSACGYLIGALLLGLDAETETLTGCVETLQWTVPLGIDGQGRWLLPTL